MKVDGQKWQTWSRRCFFMMVIVKFEAKGRLWLWSDWCLWLAFSSLLLSVTWFAFDNFSSLWWDAVTWFVSDAFSSILRLSSSFLSPFMIRLVMMLYRSVSAGFFGHDCYLICVWNFMIIVWSLIIFVRITDFFSKLCHCHYDSLFVLEAFPLLCDASQCGLQLNQYYHDSWLVSGFGVFWHVCDHS